MLRPMVAPTIKRVDLVTSWMDLQGIGRQSSKGARLLIIEDMTGEAPLPRMSVGGMVEIQRNVSANGGGDVVQVDQ